MTRYNWSQAQIEKPIEKTITREQREFCEILKYGSLEAANEAHSREPKRPYTSSIGMWGITIEPMERYYRK